MIDSLIIDLPILALFLKFMIASTLLLGSVWVLEKIGVIDTPDMSESAWKLAIAASFLALLPISLSPSNLTIPIEQSIATEYGALPTQESRAQVPAAPDPQPLPSSSSSFEFQLPERQSLTSPVATQEDAAATTRTGSQEASRPVLPRERADVQETRQASTSVSAPVSETAPVRASGVSSGVSLNPDTLLIGAWAVLALVALTALGISYARAVKSLGNRVRVPAEHHANCTLRALCETVDIRHVPYLSRSSDINSPVCLPRREICLPDWAFEDMDEKALDSLIAHELAHMLRRDPLMMIVTQTLSRIFFFQPLFTLARKRLEDNAELAADQWAATHLSTARAVATALYTCAQKITETRQIQWGLAMAGDKSILKQRVERLLKADGASFNTAGRLKRGGVAALLLAAVVSLPSIEFATAMTAAHPHDEMSEREIERMVRRLERDTLRRVRPLAPNFRPLDPRAIEEMEMAAEEIERVAEEAARAAEAAAEIAVETSVQAAVDMIESADFQAVIDAATNFPTHPRIDHHLESDGDYYSGNMQLTDDDRTVKVRWDGRFGLTDDEKSIEWVSRHGSLNIRTKDGDDSRRIRFENEDGELETTYWRNGDKQPLDADGEQWLAGTVQMLVRNTPIDMENRMERYLEQGGTKLALTKFEELETDYVRRVFASEMIEQADLSKKEVERLLKAYKVVKSDYETRLMLSKLLDEDLITKSTLKDVLELTTSIDSDYELRLTLTPLLEAFAFDDKNMERVLERALSIESDYELRLLLGAAMDAGKLSKANQKRLIKAAQSISSDYELRLVIGQFADEADMDAEMTRDLLDAIKSIDSDYEKRLGLAAIVDEGSMNDSNWMLAIEVAESISGDYEKRLALSQIRSDMPDDDKLQKAFTAAAETISGDYERERLLGKGRRR